MRTLLTGFIMLIIILVLAACGGGGGGGGGGITYTGKTTQAVITADNADELMTGALQTGHKGGGSGELPFASLSLQPEEQIPSRSLTVVRALREVVLHKLDINDAAPSASSRQVINESETIQGNCGGSATFSISANDQTGTFSGKFTFNNFCEDGETISGSIGFSGSVNLETEELIQFKMTFTALSFQACGDSYTLSGDLSFNFGTGNEVLNMNFRLRDDATGRVYKMENLVMTATVDGSYPYDELIEIAGNYYDPDHGYVKLTTTSPLRYPEASGFPTAGVLKAEGADGAWAQITASSDSYLIEADTSGDGVFDYIITVNHLPEGIVCF